MNTKSIIIWSTLSLVVLISGCNGCTTYSNLVNKDESCNGQWAQVQNVYQRRADLAQQVIGVLERSANFEKSTLAEVIQARQQVTNIQVDPNDPNSFKAFDDAQSKLGNVLSRLMVVVEKYPELKTTDQFSKFQDQIEGSENRITTERQTYTNFVTDYNKYRRQPVFPLFISRLAGFETKPYFEASDAAQSAPSFSQDANFKLND